MLDVDCSSSQGREQVNVALVEQVVALALESGVGLLLDFELDITGESTRDLITLAAEIDLVSGLDTTVNGDVQDLPLDNGLLAQAALATVAFPNVLSLAIAVLADSLEALDHGTHLAHHGSHARTVAGRTSLNGTFLASTPIALRANDGLLESKFRNLAAVDIFQ